MNNEPNSSPSPTQTPPPEAQPTPQNTTNFPDPMEYKPKPVKPLPNTPIETEQNRPKKKLLAPIIITAVVLLIAGGATAYFLLNRDLVCEGSYTYDLGQATATYNTAFNNHFKFLAWSDTDAEVIVSVPEQYRLSDSAIKQFRDEMLAERNGLFAGFSTPSVTRLSDNAIRLSTQTVAEEQNNQITRSFMKERLEQVGLTCH